MTIKAVLFDIDGTLVDSNDAHVLAWQEALDGIGAQFDLRTIHDQIGKGGDMLVPALMPDADPATIKQLGKRSGEIFRAKYQNGLTPFPGAGELLRTVAERGQKVVLATSASKQELEHHVALLDAADLLAATTSADDVEHTKPAPDVFATALGKVAPLTAQEVIAVGDSPYDCEAAAKCGIATVALRSGGFSDDVLQAAGAIALYDDAGALLRDLDNSPLSR